MAAVMVEISTKVMPMSQKSELMPEAAGEDHAAEQVAPVAEGRQAREHEVARADHLGQQVGRDALQHGHGEQEHHQRAVHGEGLVVGLHTHEVVLRQGQLRADQHGQHARDQEEGAAREHEALRDGAVVDRRQHAPAGRVAPGLVQGAVQGVVGLLVGGLAGGLLALGHRPASCATAAATAGGRGVRAAAGGAFSHASKASAGMACTTIGMCAWPAPQNSAQTPR
jgi:hypothetical protein